MTKLASAMAAVTLVVTLSSCVSIDSRIGSEIIDKEATKNLSASFFNRAEYWSGKFPAAEYLSEMFGVTASREGSVKAVLFPNRTLTLSWSRENGEEATRSYPPRRVVIAADGAIELLTDSSIETIGNFADHQSWRTRMFVNSGGSLVIEKSFREGGVGFLVIIPVVLGSYSEQLAIFPRKQ